MLLIEGHWEGMKPRDEYTEIFEHLPLFGGRTEKELAELIRASAFRSVTTEPLMEPELWTQLPSHPRYLVIAHA